MRVELANVVPSGSFSYRWPENWEEFGSGWDCIAQLDAGRFKIRHGIGGRVVYGRARVHTVTFVDGEPRVEGVAADDYERSHALLSVLRVPGGRRYVREPHQIPPGYEDFEIVSHRDEIQHQNSPRSLVVKIREDDLAAWATHAVMRELTRPSPGP
jgi:hypothetical protein